MRSRLSAVPALLVCAIVVTSCAAGLELPTPAPSPSGSSASPMPSPTSADAGPVELDSPCTQVRQLPVADDVEEQLGGMSLLVPIDRGPMPFAEGTATFDDVGVPVSYEVASGDSWEGVSARFCVGPIWLTWINSVRRSGQDLFVGDVLNLDAHTIFTVGDQNGVVHDNPAPPFKLPPQR